MLNPNNSPEKPKTTPKEKKGVLDTISNAWDKTTDWLKSKFEEIKKYVTEKIAEKIEKTKQEIDKLPNEAKSEFLSKLEKIQKAEQLGKQAGKNIDEQFPNLKKENPDLYWSKIKDEAVKISTQEIDKLNREIKEKEQKITTEKKEMLAEEKKGVIDFLVKTTNLSAEELEKNPEVEKLILEFYSVRVKGNKKFLQEKRVIIYKRINLILNLNKDKKRISDFPAFSKDIDELILKFSSKQLKIEDKEDEKQESENIVRLHIANIEITQTLKNPKHLAAYYESFKLSPEKQAKILKKIALENPEFAKALEKKQLVLLDNIQVAARHCRESYESKQQISNTQESIKNESKTNKALAIIPATPANVTPDFAKAANLNPVEQSKISTVAGEINGTLEIKNGEAVMIIKDPENKDADVILTLDENKKFHAANPLKEGGEEKIDLNSENSAVNIGKLAEARRFQKWIVENKFEKVGGGMKNERLREFFSDTQNCLEFNKSIFTYMALTGQSHGNARHSLWSILLNNEKALFDETDQIKTNNGEIVENYKPLKKAGVNELNWWNFDQLVIQLAKNPPKK